MRKKVLGICLFVSMTFLCACGNRENRSEVTEDSHMANESEQTVQENNMGRPLETAEKKEGGDAAGIPQTGMTQPVPAEYLQTAEHPGSVVQMEYGSKDYAGDRSAVTKTAYVYLPYGYNETDTDTRYDIIYLMHGWGGQEGEYFTVGNAGIKNMFEHLIEKGEMQPVIAVSATFYTENSDRDFGSSTEELREFHQDFVNHLMPVVEDRFHTYAASVSKEDLMASRDHRAFGGFSLGSVTTWMEFCYDYDYIRYFLPMSGACWYYGGYGDYYPEKTCDFFEELIEENNLNKRGYFIYAATGTQDTVRDQVEIQMEEMLDRKNVFTADRVVYYQKEGGRHDFDAVQEYLYNALPLFFQ